MNLRTKLLLSPWMAGAILAGTPAYADTIALNSGSIGQSFTLNYDGFVGSSANVIAGLTAATTFTLTNIVNNVYTFSYSIANTTTDGISSRISGFGFNTDPNISSASSTGTFGYAVQNGNYPNGIGNVDVCFKTQASGNSCAGGGGGGVTTGDPDGTGTLSLTFANAINSLTLGDFYVRYQSIEGVRGVSSASGEGTLVSSSTGGTEVPSPGATALFAGGIFALGMMLHRRRRQTAAA